MRRWITILLLVLFPLQLTWAALGSYCRHEGGEHAKHFGHHAHLHPLKTADTDDNPVPQTGKHQHDDCNACFSASITALTGELRLFVNGAAPVPLPGLQPPPLFRPAIPPDRPDRDRLA